MKKKSYIYIWGDSNTGKSTFTRKIITNYYRNKNVGVISQNKNFQLQNIENKEVIIAEELDLYKANRDSLNSYFSGEPGLIERKNKEAKEWKEILRTIIISDKNPKNLKTAIKNRLNIYKFNKKIEKKDIKEEINKILKELTPNIIIYCIRKSEEKNNNKSRETIKDLLEI